MSGVHRRHGITATMRQVPKGRDEIRDLDRSMRKQLVRDEEERLGRPLTKTERKLAKKIARGISDDVKRQHEAARALAAKAKAIEESVAAATVKGRLRRWVVRILEALRRLVQRLVGREEGAT